MVPFSNWISIKISGIRLGKNRDIFLIKRYKTKTLEFFGKIFAIFDSPRVRDIFRWKKILTFFSTHQMGIGWFELGKKYWIPVPKQLEYSSTTLFSYLTPHISYYICSWCYSLLQFSKKSRKKFNNVSKKFVKTSLNLLVSFFYL